MKSILRFLVSLAMPFILVFAGSGLVGLALEYEIVFLLYAGGLVFLAGVVWGLWLLLLSGGSAWGD